MSDMLLALMGFGLGIATTILTQIISRQFRFSDARRKHKLNNLQRLRAWMDAYHALFECKYPDLSELILSPEAFADDKTASKRAYQALKEFRETEAKYKDAERSGKEALRSLGDNKQLDRIVYPVHLLYALISGQKPYTHTYALASLYSNTRYLLWHWYSEYPRGFPRKIARYIESLSEQRYQLFKYFPDHVLSIEWDKLDFVEPDNIYAIIKSFMARGDADARKAQDDTRACRTIAEFAIERVLKDVGKQEKKWLIPEGAG